MGGFKATRSKSTKKVSIHRTGIVLVRKANMWQYFEHNNNGDSDHIEWFSTEEEANKRLLQNV